MFNKIKKCPGKNSMNINNNQNKFNGVTYDSEANDLYCDTENNCYTYAINRLEYYEDYHQCQPGNLGSGDKRDPRDIFRIDSKKYYTDMIDYVKMDLKKIGMEIISSTYEEYIENPQAWKVCLVQDIHYDSYYRDYHWYRQNLDGTWSHKPGKNSIINKDDKGEAIYNPKECSRERYNTFIGFYIIKPVDMIKTISQTI